MNNTFFVPASQIGSFMKDAAMNDQYGIQVYFTLDAQKAQALLPPPLTVGDSALGYLYIVNIRQPTFAPWYMEGGIGIMCSHGNTSGLYFLNLQLSGPGALMAMCSGREGSGLPKKLCEKIHVQRLGSQAHCFIERDGVKLVDVMLDIGQYNNPDIMQGIAGAMHRATEKNPVTTPGGCLLFKGNFNGAGFGNIDMIYYDSSTRFYRWEAASASVAFASTPNDPWAELPVTGVLGAGFMVSDNWVNGIQVIHTYNDKESVDVMQYLFSGKYDRCTLSRDHQVYE